MKNDMKKLGTLMLVALLMIAFVGRAQEVSKIEEITTYQNGLMNEKLNLSEDQRGEVSAINEKYAKKMLELREKPGGMFGKMKEIKATQQKKNEELKMILTKPQYIAYEEEVLPEIKRHMRSKMK